MTWVNLGYGPQGHTGEQGPNGSDGKIGTDGRDSIPIVNASANMAACFSADFLEELLRQAEDDFAANRLDDARPLLVFVQSVARQGIEQ